MWHAFQISLRNKSYEFFKKVLQEQENVWICNKADPSHYRPLINSNVTSLLGSHNGFIAPILAGGRTIGVFYTARKSSNRKLDDELFNAFCLFVQQANICLMMLANKRRR